MTTREKLMQSAIKLFSQNGFEATSTNAICKHAGFSAGTLFVHFETKNDLLDSIYLEIKKEYFQAAAAGIDIYSQDMEVFGKGMFQGANYYLQNPEKFFFMKRFIHSPHLSRIAQEEIKRESVPIIAFFTAGKKRGIVKDIPNSELLHTLIGASYGLIESLIEQKQKMRSEHIDMLLAIIRA